MLKQPDLARTLEALAKDGFDGFYRGPVAKKLLAGVRAQGGRWTADELASYRVQEREPLRLPTVTLNEAGKKINDIHDFRMEHFELNDYNPHPSIPKIPVAT